MELLLASRKTMDVVKSD